MTRAPGPGLATGSPAPERVAADQAFGEADPDRAKRQALLARAIARSTRLDPATALHFATLAGVVAFWAWLDRGLWFFGDEWAFLVDRGLGYPPGSTHGIWFPHNEHWSTLPVLAWRALFSLWHLSSYWPYLGLLLAVQVAVVHLAWRACRRAGAAPLVSTAAALLLGFLGAGAEDFGWAFQVGFVGSVAFGLLALDLLDRPTLAVDGQARGPGSPPPSLGPASPPSYGDAPLAFFRRPLRARAVFPTGRDLAASGALLASLMCSTVGDAMVVGAAVVAFARLPRARALRALWPPVAAYVVWFAGVGHLGIAAHSDHFGLTTFTSLPGYVLKGLALALGRAFNFESAGAALLAGLAVWVAWHWRQLWTQRPALVGLAASALAFYALAAVGRDTSEGPGASRYVYVSFALLLPLVASVLSGRPRPGAGAVRVGAVALLVVTALGNVGQAESWVSSRTALTSSLKARLLAIGELVDAGTPDVSGPRAAPVPGDPNLQVAEIARLEREDLLPRPHMTPLALFDARAVLALGVWNGVDMTLSPVPLSSVPFHLLGTSYAHETARHGGCFTFAPETVNPPMQVRLAVPAGYASASVEIDAGAASPRSTRYADVSLVQRRATDVTGRGQLVSAPVGLAVPASGTGWLDDDDPGSEVVVSWASGTPLSLCGFGRKGTR